VADTDKDIAAMESDEAMTRRALDLLGPSRRNDAYEAALAALREDTQARWADTLAGDPDELGEDEDQSPPMSRACAASSKVRCCRGLQTGGRNWPTGR
jgi:hypothetical protein